jgi:putative transposase
MSWVRVWIHTVFTTKNREPLIQQDFRGQLFDHIKKNAKEKGIRLIEVNGYIDHVHCLIALNKDLSISKSLQLIKGESSFWVNKNKLCTKKFAWQDDYWAVGLSESHFQSVQHYIQNQEEHHRKISFKEEIDKFMMKYGWSWLAE